MYHFKYGFQIPREHLKRQVRQRKREFVLGKGGSSTLKGAPRYSHLFVFRVEKNTEDKVVKEYIKGKGVAFHEVKCISNAESVYKSYKVTILLKDKDRVLSADFWPDDIGCREFIPGRKRRDENGPLQKKE